MLITILFSSNRLNTSQISWLFLIFSSKQAFCPWTRKNRKLSLLDVEVSWEKEKFKTTVYRKPIFNGVCTHFESFLPSVYKFRMVYTCLSLFQNLLWLNKVSWRTYFFGISFFYKTGTLCHLWMTVYDKLTTVEKKTLFLSLVLSQVDY